MKYSKQRETILAAAVEEPAHPTADSVYRKVREECPQISLGTVYRDLNQLVQNGLLIKIPVANGSDRFDGRLDEHYHMICDGCGEVFDANIDCFSDIDAKIMQETGFCIKGRQLIMNGLCGKCRKEAL